MQLNYDSDHVIEKHSDHARLLIGRTSNKDEKYLS